MIFRKKLFLIVCTFVVVETLTLAFRDNDRIESENDKDEGIVSNTGRSLRPSSNICPKLKLQNGRVKMRGKGRVARFICVINFELVGKRYATCVRGHWTNPPPVCVAKGCKSLDPPKNGHKAEAYKGAFISFTCDPGYLLIGPQYLYCDSFKWNGTQPSCEPATKKPATFCDFETEDLCGWSHDPTHVFDWKRHRLTTPSGHVGTGPSYDHTKGDKGEGYYMYIEASSPRKENDVARLLSPVYPPVLGSDSCFSFWYHMYGSTTGSLNVYVKPESQSLIYVIPSFSKSGNQGNRWILGRFPINMMTENFQIIIEGIRGVSYISDIAIDDVNLGSTTDCVIEDDTSSISPVSIPQSMQGTCHERCGFDNPEMEVCECNEGCSERRTCCSDYESLCIYTDGSTGVVSNMSLTPQPEVTLGYMTSSVVVSTRSTLKSSDYLTSESISSLLTLSETTTPLYSSPIVLSSDYLTNSKKDFTASLSTFITVSPPVVASSNFEQSFSSSSLISSPETSIYSSMLSPSQVIKSSPIMSSTPTPFLSSDIQISKPILISIPFISSSLSISSSILSTKPFSSVILVTPTSSRVPITLTHSVIDTGSISTQVLTSKNVPVVTTVTKPTTETSTKSTTKLSTIPTTKLTTKPSTKPTTIKPTISTKPIKSAETSSTVVPSSVLRPTTSPFTRKITSSSSSTTQSPITITILNITVPQTISSPKPKIYPTWQWKPKGKTTKTTLPTRTNENEIIKSDSLKGTSSTPITAGIIVASILIAILVAIVIYMIHRRRKTKQDLLAEDSDIRYLKDGEIQMEFSDGSRRYEDAYDDVL